MQIYEPKEGQPIDPPDAPPSDEDGAPLPEDPGEDKTVVDQPGLPLPPTGRPQKKVYVDGVGATIVAERVDNGKLVTESLRDFTKRALRKRFASLDEFLKRWNACARQG